MADRNLKRKTEPMAEQAQGLTISNCLQVPRGRRFATHIRPVRKRQPTPILLLNGMKILDTKYNGTRSTYKSVTVPPTPTVASNCPAGFAALALAAIDPHPPSPGLGMM